MKTVRLCAVLGAIASFTSSSLFAAEEGKPADPQAQPKITFDEHILPIFREHCLSCHNQNEAKSDLALDTYARTMAGGAGGEVVVVGDLESSRLYALVAHVESPKMPPNQDRIADAKVDLLKKWVMGGALENNGSKAKVKPAVDLQLKVTANNKPAGPPAMPETFRREPYVVSERPGSTTAIAASPWASLVAVASQKQIILYNTDTTELLTIWPFPEGVAHVLKFSRDGSVLLAAGGRGGASGKVVLFDVKTGKRITEIGDELDAVLAADVTNDLSLVALGGPKRMVRVYSVADGSLVYELKKHTDWITALEFSPDGTLLATADRSAGLLIWEAAAGREYQNLTGHTGGVTDVSWRADSKFLASIAEDGNMFIWNIDIGKPAKSRPVGGGGGLSIRFGTDGLVSGGRNKKVTIWAQDYGSTAAETAPLPDMVMDVALSYDGKRIIAGDWSGACRVYDAKSGKPLGELMQNPLPLARRAVFTAQRAVELQQAAQAAEAALAEQRKQVASLREIEQKITDKANHVSAEIKRLEDAKPKLEREVPVKRQRAKDLAAKFQEIRTKLVEAEKSQQETLAAVAKSPDSPNAKKQHELTQERVKGLKASLAATDADIKAREAELKKMEQELAQASKDLPNFRNQVKPTKAELEKATNTRLEAERLLPAKEVAAKEAANAAANAEREAAQAAADKAEFDKLGPPQASVTK